MGMAAGIHVLVVDSDATRARSICSTFARLGAVPAIATDLTKAESMWSMAELIIVDDDAFGDAGRALLAAMRKKHASTFTCLAARAIRFLDAAKNADYVFAKPFGAPSLGDALAARRAKQAVRRAAKAAATSHASSGPV
jgi:DNA-binding response OmpR family regulator